MRGIDISVFNKYIDYKLVKEQGIEFAIIRAGYGKNESQKDTMFEKHYQGCKENNIKVGSYLYSYAETVEGAKLEAENCLKFIKGKTFELPIFYDVEDKNQSNLSKETLTKMCIVFCETIEKAGYKAGVYANLYWWNNKLDVKELEKYNIWLAQWSSKPTANFRVDIWQCSSEYHVMGINGKVDYDICYKDYSQSVDNSVNNLYKIGTTYKTQVILKVRENAGTEYRQKLFIELTPNARQNAYFNGCLKVGCKVTCLEVKKDSKGNIWIRIPSGWVAGFYDNKYYIK